MASSTLILGATGHVGSALAREFRLNQIPFRALVRPGAKTEHLQHPEIELMEGDLQIPQSLDKALMGVQKVFLNSSLDPNLVELQGNLVKAAQRAGVSHIVKLSSVGVHPESDVSFFQWHWQAEQQIRDLKIPYTFLQPHYFMQNTIAFKESIHSAGSVFLPIGNGRISLVDVRDVAKVAFVALTQKGHENMTYPITGPQALNFSQITQMLSDGLARQIRFVTIPPQSCFKSMKDANIPDWLAEGTLMMYRYFDYNDTSFISPVVKNATRNPPKSFREFVEDYARFFA